MKQWKKYYTRPTAMQDFEVPIVRPLFEFSDQLVGEVLYISFQGKWEGWYKERQFEDFLKKLAERILENDWELDEHLRLFERESENLLNTAKQLAHQPADKKADENTKPYRNLLEAYIDFSVFIWLPWAVTYYLEDWYVDKLKQSFGQKWMEIYEVVGSATKPIQTQRMIERAWQWQIENGSDKELQKVIDEFGYLNVYSVNDKAWTAKEILKQAEINGEPEQELKKAREARTENKKKIEAVLSKIKKKDEILEKVGRVIHEYVWLRTERVDVYKKTMFLSSPFYRWLEERGGWEYGWAAHLSFNEILNILAGEAAIDNTELKKRDELQYIAYMIHGKTEVITDKKEREKFLDSKLGKQRKQTIGKLKGKTAFPGKVKGKVKILLYAKDSYDFEEGRILVANMTHPDYMPAVRKAAAIVTDEGGILSHAAVISRELKTPCVIGTNEATKTLKDGDLVEVDADRGVIKKL